MVDFVVAGAQKCGTRALGHFLSQNLEIGLSLENRIEPHFFDWILKKVVPDNATKIYNYYHGMFSPRALSLVTGDITPNYLYCTEALARIRAYNPAMKVIVLLRNPIDRAYSQWVMQVEMGKEIRAFPTRSCERISRV